MCALFFPSRLPAFSNLLSSVKYVPEWMPGASFKRKAREWRGVAERFYTIPFDFVKQSMKEGTAKSSFTSLALRDVTEKDRDYQEELIKGLGGTMYTGALPVFFSLERSDSRYGLQPALIRYSHNICGREQL